VGKPIKTPRFELCGRTWVITIYLNGDHEPNTGFVALHLFPDPLCDKLLGLRISFAIFAGCAATGEPIWKAEGSNPIQPNSGTGWSKAIRREDLLRRAVADSVAVRLTIGIGSEPYAAAVSRRRDCPAEPGSALAHDMAALLDSGDGADVVLRVAGRDFRAHKLVLGARSAVMRAMLDGRFKEGAAAEPVELRDIEPETAEQLLRFVYTGGVRGEPGFDMWAALLVAADMLDIKDLFLVAQHRLAADMTKQSALACVAVAVRLQTASQLLEAALDYLAGSRLAPEDLDKLDGDTAKELLKRNARLASSSLK
jgi:speckle-type POZ protein